MQAGSIPYQHTALHYLFGGKGKRVLFCFHGFGESAAHFNFLESSLQDEFTLIAIDLPFHGNSFWNNELDIDPPSLLQLMDAIREKHGLAETPYELLGYSMGGRISLSLLEITGNNIRKVTLLAPDGFKVNFWYWLATQTFLGNKLFSLTIERPGPFLWIVKQLHRTGLLNQSIHKYVYAHLYEKEKRKQLYLRWTCLRKFRPHLPTIQKKIQQEQIPLIQLYGQHDRIILPNRGRKFSEAIMPFGKLEIINAGHRLLDEKHLRFILPYLLATKP